MNKSKLKLLMTAGAFLMSIVLLVTASLAWYSISTAPEISGIQVTLFTDLALLVSKTDKQEDFTQSIDLSELLADYAPLKPVSTVDGINWFIPTYDDTTGMPKDASEFILDDELAHGNIKIVDANGVPLDGVELFEAEQLGYYIYCDFWLATEYEEDVRVTLSAPDRDKNNLQAWEIEEPSIDNPHGAKYGSYAMAMYERDEENGGIYRIDNNAQTALRVGFLIENDDETSTFVIYEPNADKRSELVDKPTGEEFYIHDYELDPDTYKDNVYIPTYPIGKAEDGTYKPMAIPTDKLIVQMAGQWKQNALQTRIAANQNPNSNDVLMFGRFFKNTSDLTGALQANGKYANQTFDINAEANQNAATDLASSSIIVTLKGREADGTLNPTKIRMFIWIEGQDVDCWNDIAGGTFVVNLEFAAQSE